MSQGESVCGEGAADIGSIEAFLRSLFFWEKIKKEVFLLGKDRKQKFSEKKERKQVVE